MKKIVCLLVTLAILIGCVPMALAAEKSEFTYTKLTDSTVCITGYSGTATNLVIPSKLDGYTVTEYSAKLRDSTIDALESVTFPDTVTKISGTINWAYKLKSAKLPKNLKIIPAKMFSNCRQLKELTLPEKLRKIGAYAFLYTNVKKIDLPDTLTYIGNSAFKGSALTELKLPESLRRINAEAFKYCDKITELVIPDGVRTIERAAFSGLGIKSVKIGKDVKTIKPKVFINNTNLESIEVDENNPYYCSVDGVLYTKDMKTLVQYPQNKSGESFTVPESVTRIGACAFTYAANLKEVKLGENVYEIANKAFKSCENLEKINLPESLIRIGAQCFRGCRNLPSLSIPDGVTKIKEYTFNDCTNLSELKLPSKLRVIESEAFEHCSALTELTLPDTIESIGSWAFYYAGIKTITIPNVPDYIFRYSLSGMYSLTEVNLLNPDADYTRFFYRWSSTLENIEKITLGDKVVELNVGESADVDSNIYMMSGEKNFEIVDAGVASLDTSTDDHITLTGVAPGETTVTMNCNNVYQNVIVRVK